MTEQNTTGMLLLLRVGIEDGNMGLVRWSIHNLEQRGSLTSNRSSNNSASDDACISVLSLALGFCPTAVIPRSSHHPTQRTASEVACPAKSAGKLQAQLEISDERPPPLPGNQVHGRCGVCDGVLCFSGVHATVVRNIRQRETWVPRFCIKCMLLKA